MPRSSVLLLGLAALLLFSVPAVRAEGEPHPALSVLESQSAWKLLAPPRTFGPQNLYEEIDGEAELFLPYGMRRLTVAIVGDRSRPGAEARLELYRMDSPRDAFGIWSQHRYPDQETVAMHPSEVVVSDMSADLHRGDTFVRLRAKPDGDSRRLVLDLAKSVVAALHGDGAPPEEARILDRFPGREPGTILYQKRAMMGYECLAPGFEAKFACPSSSGRLALLPPTPGPDGGSRRLERLAAELPGFSAAAPGLFRASLPSGTLWLAPSGGCVAGVAGNLSRAEAEPLLSILAAASKALCAGGGGDR
ncbi:MAG: hypothetical protein HZB63_04095 [Deltaproteobacteria bacterium]|nr:hypothetical protein [Deltaproteobacteria bacterium]